MASYVNKNTLKGLLDNDTIKYYDTDTTIFLPKKFKIRIKLYGNRNSASYGGYVEFILNTNKLKTNYITFLKNGDLCYGSYTSPYYRIATPGDGGHGTSAGNGGYHPTSGPSGYGGGAATTTSGGSAGAEPPKPSGIMIQGWGCYSGTSGGFASAGKNTAPTIVSSNNTSGDWTGYTAGGYGFYGGGGGGIYIGGAIDETYSRSYKAYGGGGGSGFLYGKISTPSGYMSELSTGDKNALKNAITYVKMDSTSTSSYPHMTIEVIEAASDNFRIFRNGVYKRCKVKYYTNSGFKNCKIHYYDGIKWIDTGGK